MKNDQSKLIILTLAMLTSWAVQAGTVGTDFTPSGTLTAGQMTEIKNAVNDNDTNVKTNATGISTNAGNIGTNSSAITDHDTRIGTNAGNIGTNSSAITDHDTRIGTNAGNIGTNTVNIGILDSQVTTLEGKSPAIGRIVVPVVSVSAGATISGAKGFLPDAQSTTAFGGSFGVPTDYVSGDVTVKAVVTDCAGSSIAHENGQPGLDQVNIGANTAGFLLLSCTGFGTCPTVSIPPNTGAFPFITSFAVEVVRTYSSISDINTPAFRRHGANLGDVCTGSLTVEGFIIEYPRGN